MLLRRKPTLCERIVTHMQTMQQPSPTSYFGKKLCGLRSFFGSIGRYSLGKEYEFELALYPDGETDTPLCSHQFGGSSRHNLMKITALAALLLLAITAVATLMRVIACGLSHVFRL